jgi:hypothetical protein
MINTHGKKGEQAGDDGDPEAARYRVIPYRQFGDDLRRLPDMSVAIPDLSLFHIGDDFDPVLIESPDRFRIRPATDGTGRLFKIRTERKPRHDIDYNKKQPHGKRYLLVFLSD